jgi:hypothetical protein
MKRLVLMVATLGIATSAMAQDADIKNSGEFRLRYDNVMDKDATANTADSHSNFMHRFKWNITARKGENLQAMLGLIHGARWGYDTAAQANGGATVPGNGMGGATGSSEDSIIVNRAWGWWKSSDALSFKFGRMGIEIADGAVFSENDWEAIPTMHEGVMGLWDMDFAKIGLFGVKNFDVDTNPGGDPERNIYGVSLDLKNMPEAIKTANIHFLQDSINAGGVFTSGSTNRQHIGATVGGDVAGFLYKGTLGYQTGKNALAGVKTDLNAMMYDLMLGYGLPEIMGLKVSAGYHMDTGDKTVGDTKNEQYDPLFYDRHNYAGLMDVVGWGNLTYWNVNASLMPMETVEAGLGFYMFSKTESAGTVNAMAPAGQATTWFSGVTTPGSSKELGSEIDLYANKAYDNGLKIGVRYSMFMAGKYLTDGTPKADEDPSEIFAQASLSF